MSPPSKVLPLLVVVVAVVALVCHSIVALYGLLVVKTTNANLPDKICKAHSVINLWWYIWAFVQIA